MKNTKKNVHVRKKGEIIASVFFKYNEIEYAGAIVIPVKNLSEKKVREQGYQLVDAIIRTLQQNGALTSK